MFDSFGRAVGIDGNYALVGAPGVGAQGEGHAYIFAWDGTSWSEPALLTASDGAPDVTVHLEPKVMQVLVYLAEHAGQVVSKHDLMRNVWPDTFVGDDVLTRAISELRRVFGDDAKNPSVIQTIPKSGYRLIALYVRATASHPSNKSRGPAGPRGRG